MKRIRTNLVALALAIFLITVVLVSCKAVPSVALDGAKNLEPIYELRRDGAYHGLVYEIETMHSRCIIVVMYGAKATDMYCTER